MPVKNDDASVKGRHESECICQISYEVLYGLRQEDKEIELLCSFSSTFSDFGLVFKYIEVGKICVIKTDVDIGLAEEIREMVGSWFAHRADIVSYEVKPLSCSYIKVRDTLGAHNLERQVLLLIPPSVH